MDFGTLILIIVAGLFLLLLLFLPKITGRSPKSEPRTQREIERENAYRRGLMIGGLMEEPREMHQGDQSQIIEQVVVEQMIIEQIQHNRNMSEKSE